MDVELLGINKVVKSGTLLAVGACEELGGARGGLGDPAVTGLVEAQQVFLELEQVAVLPDGRSLKGVDMGGGLEQRIEIERWKKQKIDRKNSLGGGISSVCIGIGVGLHGREGPGGLVIRSERSGSSWTSIGPRSGIFVIQRPIMEEFEDLDKVVCLGADRFNLA